MSSTICHIILLGCFFFICRKNILFFFQKSSFFKLAKLLLSFNSNRSGANSRAKTEYLSGVPEHYCGFPGVFILLHFLCSFCPVSLDYCIVWLLFDIFNIFLHQKTQSIGIISQEEFEDNKGIIRICKSKNRQNNGQEKKYKRTNNINKTYI